MLPELQGRLPIRVELRALTEEEIAAVHCATAEDVDRAVLAAHRALKDPSWKRLPATERGMLMTKLADLMDQNKELLATIDAWDNGEPHRIHELKTLIVVRQAL